MCSPIREVLTCLCNLNWNPAGLYPAAGRKVDDVTNALTNTVYPGARKNIERTLLSSGVHERLEDLDEARGGLKNK